MNIEELILSGSLGPYTQNGIEYMIRCPSPDHNDSKPSCSVNTKKNVFFCHGCGEKGHVKKIGKWLGEDIKYDVNAKKEYQKKYIPQYIDSEVLDCYQYEPTEWIDGTMGSFDPEVLLSHKIGYDIIQNRITVPVFSSDGKLVFISGRTTIEHPARYKLYKDDLQHYQPNNYEPKRGHYLWRHHMLPDNMSTLIVVEGFKAAMHLVMHGWENVVATMGKAVTDVQTQLLSSFRIPIILFFDGDEPGVKGQKALGIKLYNKGVSVSYANIREGMSPDDLTQSEISQTLNGAKPHRRKKHELESTSKVFSAPKEGTHSRRRRKLSV